VLSLNSDGSLINKATAGKWGLRVGRVVLELRRAGELTQTPVVSTGASRSEA